MDDTTTPRFFRAARAWLGLNQKEAADLMGLSYATLGDAEKGRKAEPKTVAAGTSFYASKGLRLAQDGSRGMAVIVIDTPQPAQP